MVMEKFLTRVFPNLEFSSSGVSAVNGSPVPDSIKKILKEWGFLDYPDSNFLQSKKFDSTGNFQSTTIIASDLKTQLHLLARLPIAKVFNLADYGSRLSVTLSDPVKMSRNRLKTELSKHIYVCYQLVRELNENSLDLRPAITGITMPTADALVKVQSILISEMSRNTNTLIFDVTFLDYYNKVIFDTSPLVFKHEKLNFNDFSAKCAEKSSNYFILDDSSSNSEKIWVSHQYISILQEIARNREVILLLPPLFELGSASSDFYLAAIPCTRLLGL